MKDKLKIACVQLCAGIHSAQNISIAVDYIRQAGEAGADMVSLPEMVNLMQIDREQAKGEVYYQHEDKGLRALCDVARELKLWLHIGSMSFLHEDEDGKKFVNRGFMVNANGEIVSTYDKLHMFDVDLENGESYRESSAYVAGDEVVVAETDWGLVGLSICYDLRFGNLYRLLAQRGARMLMVPAAFTKTTGERHWHHLLRGRAIECGAWVIACNQGGEHADGRLTYGHSCVVDPDGVIVMDGGEKIGVHIAEVDLALADEARRKIPSLRHDISLNGQKKKKPVRQHMP